MSKLNQLRIEQKLTQKGIADELGITLRAWQSYEYNQRLPNVPDARRIAKYFNTTMEELFNER